MKKLIFMLAFLAGAVFADVQVEANGNSVSITNETYRNWTFGGARIKGDKYTVSGSSGGYAWSILSPNPNSPNVITDIYMKPDAAAWMLTLSAKGSDPASGGFSSVNFGLNSAPDPDSLELLLKFNNVPDEPMEWVTNDDINRIGGPDSKKGQYSWISLNPADTDNYLENLIDDDFYNPNYKLRKPNGTGGWEYYYDSLGVNGGKYSGGFMDTYRWQTQLHFVIPKSSFTVNGTTTRAIKADKAPNYYMALAIGQEFLRADAQGMFSQGTKESFSGTMQLPWSTHAGTNTSGNWSNWHVETFSMTDRALGYPQFFPYYEQKLAAAINATTFKTSSGLSGYPAYEEFCTYYMKGYDETSVQVVNGLFCSVLFEYVNYEVMARSLNYKWKCMLDYTSQNGDPYLGLASMYVMYNVGQWDMIGKVGPFISNESNWTNKNAHYDLLFAGNLNYRDDIFRVVQALTDAQKEFQGNSAATTETDNAEIIDFKITLPQLRALFFGTGGTVEKQGNDGGLLLHYEDPEAGADTGPNSKRQKVWDNLGGAFDILKGRAPTSDANTISYRYDLLSCLRAVKSEIIFERSFQVKGDASTLIPGNSNRPAPASELCESVRDEIYPYATISVSPDENICAFEVKMKDDTECKRVKWVISDDWKNWNEAGISQNTSETDKTFTFEITKDMAENGDPIWIMAEDGAGNAVVKKAELKFTAIPQMKWAAVFDESNPADGYPDSLQARIKNISSTRDAKFFIRWGQKQNENITDKINIGEDFLNASGLNLTEGSDNNGWFILEYIPEEATAPVRDSVKLSDYCGPAITKADFFPAKDGDEFDTLKVAFTETIEYNAGEDGIPLNLKDFSNNINSSVTSSENDLTYFLYDIGKLTDSDGNLLYDSVNIKLGECLETGGLPEGVDTKDIPPLKLVCENSISDIAKNPALENNKWVKITDHTKPSLLPEVISAEMLDRWGDQIDNSIVVGGRDYLPEYINRRADGIGDILVVKLKLSDEDGAYTAQEIDSVEFTWDNKKYNTKTIVPNFDNTEFYIFDNTVTGGAGIGNVKIFFTDEDGNVETTESTINDKVAPVIVSGSYERYDDRADTLRVKFSEEILNAEIGIMATSGQQLFKLASFNKDFAVYSLQSGNLVSGDSIWIDPIAATPRCMTSDCPTIGLCEDLLENKQISDNQHIKIDYAHFVSFDVENAAYSDESNPADGYVDLITAEFKLSSTGISVETDEIKKIVEKFVLNDNRKFNEIKATDITVSGNTIEIKVMQDKKNVAAKTDVDENDVISVEYKTTVGEIGILASIKNEKIADKIAPIITKGQYAPMEISNDNDEIKDTLRIWFSEKVTGKIAKDMLKAFDFSNSGAEYDIAIEEQNATNSDYLEFSVILNDANPLPETGDSIRIQYGIFDNAGNEQKVSTIWSILEVGKYIYNYDIKIYPNPYNPNNPKFPTINGELDINPITNDKNMVFMIKPFGNRKLVGELSGEFVVLDQLGNKIYSNNLEFKDGALIRAWNGKNTSGRNVGSGSYHAIIQINNNASNDSQTILKKVGIKN